MNAADVLFDGPQYLNTDPITLAFVTALGNVVATMQAAESSDTVDISMTAFIMVSAHEK